MLSLKYITKYKWVVLFLRARVQVHTLVVRSLCDSLREGRADRFERLFKHRKRLEQDWASATLYKKEKEQEDRERMVTPGGLMHEQCDKYRRCGQCKRHLQNCGESNIWRETRYIPGTRIMV